MWDWTWKKWLVFLLPAILLVAGAVVWLLMRRTIRTRLRMERQLRDDPDINEWLVIFGWSRKVLYFPVIAASVAAGVLTLLREHGVWAGLNPYVVGGAWMAVFFLNFLVDEYEMSVKVLLIVVLCLLVLFLWLSFLDWVEDFLRLFRRLRISLNALGYLLFAGILLMAVAISWIRGLFYYVAVTPNYLNIQIGPTETGEQVSREEYSTRVDTGDFLERLLGFGRIVVTFADQRRQPILLLVGRVGKRAAKLESIRGKLAVDRHQPYREGEGFAAGVARPRGAEAGPPEDL